MISKAKEDQVKNENLIGYNRTTYKEITKSYDFMQFLDEIAGYSVGEGSESNGNKLNSIESGLDSIALHGETTLVSAAMEEEKEAADAGSDNEEEIPKR